MSRRNDQPYQQRSFIVDPGKVKPREPEREIGAVWHHELVAERLIEAAATVRRMPMRIWPKQFGCIWPAFNAMTISELTAFKNELIAEGGEGALRTWEQEQNRVRIPPSGREIERADQALSWVPRYLGHDSETAKIVGFWATKTYDLEDEIPGPVRIGLREISRGLRRDKVPVRA